MVGATLLLVALSLASASPAGTSWQVFVGLFLLGLGWSFATVAGSTMITDNAPLDVARRHPGSLRPRHGAGGGGGERPLRV